MELSKIKEIVKKAKELMDKQGYDPLLALQIVEKEMSEDKIIKEKYLGGDYDYRF